MKGNVLPIDNQPIAATFFGEGRWLTDFITPRELEVQKLLKDLTINEHDLRNKIINCRDWVAQELRYVVAVRAKITVEGKSSSQPDYWMPPSMAILTKVGNCAVKSFLLTSLLRNLLSENSVYCVLGNLYSGTPGGHAWTEINLDGEDFLLEATRPDVPPLIPISEVSQHYEAVHYFNDKQIYAVPGKTQMEIVGVG